MRLFGFGKSRTETPNSGAPQHILVPFENTPSDREVMRFACQLAISFKAKITTLHVVQIPRSVPLDDANAPGLAEGHQSLAAAREIAQDMDIDSFESILKTAHHAGHAIVQVAQEVNADVLMIGARHRRKRSASLLDDTVETVLRKAHCFVWLHRSALEDY